MPAQDEDSTAFVAVADASLEHVNPAAAGTEQSRQTLGHSSAFRRSGVPSVPAPSLPILAIGQGPSQGQTAPGAKP